MGTFRIGNANGKTFKISGTFLVTEGQKMGVDPSSKVARFKEVFFFSNGSTAPWWA
jgi:hypothetical protein